MKNKEIKKEKWKYTWAVQALFITFALSLLFSFISTNAINNLSLVPAILILFFVILLGIITDIIGVAVTVGSEEDFHAKASKKIEGAKSSIKLIKSSAKVANICCDVIGDICGVLSGAISAMLAVRIVNILNINIDMNFLIGAVVAAVNFNVVILPALTFAKFTPKSAASFANVIVVTPVNLDFNTANSAAVRATLA